MLYFSALFLEMVFANCKIQKPLKNVAVRCVLSDGNACLIHLRQHFLLVPFIEIHNKGNYGK